MKSKIIAKGKVMSAFPPQGLRYETEQYYLIVHTAEWWTLGAWAKPYVGKVLTISVEEEDR